MVKGVYVKSILNRHKIRDSWFLDDYSLNPYKLCQFNCIYCYIHGSKYGKNVKEFAVKINAPRLLRKELAKLTKSKKYGFIALSSATEPWQNIEEKYCITRKCLEIIANFKFPVHCLTKSKLILRDLDLLRKIDENAILPKDLATLKNGCLITISLSTLDEKIAKIFEPNAPRPKERLEVLYKLREEGFHAGIAYIPVLPFISDSKEKLEEMISKAKEYNASYVFVGALTLYGEGKELYYKAIKKHFPELLQKYERFRFKGYQKKLEEMAKEICKDVGIKYKII